MAALASGSRLGPFEILDGIGEGGMGEVYRATDTRLKRQVALKVLPSSVTADPDRLARFQREAEVLASLNHPNIAGLHGLEESGGVKALVMELVEGPTLADRIAQGPVPIDEALTIARQIADALAAAHDQGIIHRDLKPANVKLRPDGTVKVLDFGLAKALDQGSGIGDQGSGKTKLANSPTMTSPAMTMHGVILGTAAYMSPEQAAGKPVDRRTDMWAFGVVLFEMLTGRQLFDGESVSHVLAAVLKDDPDWSALPLATPPAIRKLLRRCLERDRKKRWPDAAAAAIECGDALVPGDQAATTGSVAAARSPWQLAAALVAGIVIAGVGAWSQWPVEAPRPVTRFEIELPDNRIFTRAGRHIMAISPDGARIAYVANRQIFVRPLNEATAETLEGTAESDPSEPVFSPDGQWLAFWSDNQIKKIPVAGGTPVILAKASNPFGMVWTGDRITLGVNNPPSILAVPAAGGATTDLVTLASDELAQTPQLLNGGRAVLFTLLKGEGLWQDANVVVQDLATGSRRVLVEGGTDARAVAGYLIYERESTLFAVAFDEERLTVSGSPVPVQTNVQESAFSGAAQAAISSSGSLVFVPAGASGSLTRVLVWLDYTGKTERLKFPPAPHFGGRSQRVSPDGKRIASRMVGSSMAASDIWIGEIDQGIFRRLTFSGRATDPVWSADGSRVCYEQQDEVFCQPADGSGSAQPLLKWPRISALEDVSPDGRWLLFSQQPDASSRFLTHIVDTQSPSDIRPLMGDGSSDRVPAVSPDGRLVAYVSGELADEDIYVRPFPSVDGGRWQVSTTGGNRPAWSHDGRQLFYLDAASAGQTTDVTVMKVAVRPGPSFSVGAPEPVVKLPPNAGFNFSVASDGRFLIDIPASEGVTGRSRLVVVENWLEEVKAKVPR